jgi:amino acid permease
MTEPGPFAHYIYQNDVGVFLGVWYAIPNALFAYIGTELIGVTGKLFEISGLTSRILSNKRFC